MRVNPTHHRASLSPRAELFAYDVAIRDAAAEAVASPMASMIVEEACREGVRMLVVGDILYTASSGKRSSVCNFEVKD
jgi:hypothetical protein